MNRHKLLPNRLAQRGGRDLFRLPTVFLGLRSGLPWPLLPGEEVQVSVVDPVAVLRDVHGPGLRLHLAH